MGQTWDETMKENERLLDRVAELEAILHDARSALHVLGSEMPEAVFNRLANALNP